MRALVPRRKSLEGVFAFNDLKKAARAELEKICVWQSYNPYAQIVEQHDQSNSVYFVASGRVRVVVYSSLGKIVTFRTLESGQMFGEIAAIDGKVRSSSVEALEVSLIAKITANTFWALIDSEPEFRNFVIQHLNQLVRSLSSRVYEFSTLSLQNRVHAEILRLAWSSRTNDNSAVIQQMPTHAELASRISTNREAVTRELNRLAEIGLIEKIGTKLHIKQFEQLVRLVEDATGESSHLHID